MAEEYNPWKTLSDTCVYENRWIRVNEHEVINPSGGRGIYGKVHFKNLAIGIVALDADLQIWLVGQYRYSLDQYSWEIPEGGGAMGADPLLEAKRELLEETGIVAARWEKLLDLHLSNSVSDEVSHIYLARDFTFQSSQPEETELLSVKKVPLDEAYQLVLDGQITDAVSVAGILRVKLLVSEQQIRT